MPSSNICYNCVDEPFLKKEIESKGKRRKCQFCSATAKCYKIDELADRVEQAFERHFCRSSDEPTPWQYALLKDKESDYMFEREGEPVIAAIADAAVIPEEAAALIQEILADRHYSHSAAEIGEECEFDPDSRYIATDVSDHYWREEWRKFEKILKTESRYFNQHGLKHLSEIFTGIEKLETKDHRSIIVHAGPGSPIDLLYRARVFQSDEKLIDALKHPDLQLGTPPSWLVASGRMNAKGIAVFYGAAEEQAALAEVRPPVGSQVAIAPFQITRPIRLLDLTALKDVREQGSIFDNSYAERLKRAKFLQYLCEHMTKPVMPDDTDSEYLITQAIADYLASGFVVDLDGIIYPCKQIQPTSTNVALFHKASRIEQLLLPAGTHTDVKLWDYFDDALQRTYQVYNEVPNEALNGSAGNDLPTEDDLWRESPKKDGDERPTTLRILADSLKVYVISSIRYDVEIFDVNRVMTEGSTSFGPDVVDF